MIPTWIDWKDVGLHVMGSVVIVPLFTLVGWWLGPEWALGILMFIIWPLREALQRNKDPDDEYWWKFSTQNHWEAWPAAIVALGLAVALSFV